ncbi:unnamed protein product, partial [Protopolystoma xenopodis]
IRVVDNVCRNDGSRLLVRFRQPAGENGDSNDVAASIDEFAWMAEVGTRGIALRRSESRASEDGVNMVELLRSEREEARQMDDFTSTNTLFVFIEESRPRSEKVKCIKNKMYF